MSEQLLVRVKTDNDTNGNPRRGWLIMSGDSVTGWLEEGHLGELGAVRAAGLEGVRQTLAIKVSISEFKRLKKAGLEAAERAEKEGK